MIAELYEKAFARCTAELVALDTGVRLSNDPDAIHDARVALRHLRSYLRTFRTILDRAWAEGLRDRMRWLDEHLAAAHDLDVLVALLEVRGKNDDGEPVPRSLLDELRTEREERHDRMRAALHEPRYLVLLEEIVAAARSPQFVEAAQEPARKALPKLMGAVWRRLRKRVHAYDNEPTDAALHKIRIAAKHVRYAAECFEPLREKRAKRLAKHAARLQMLLGDHHDAVMAAARLAAQPSAPEVAGLRPKPPRWRRMWYAMEAAYNRLT